MDGVSWSPHGRLRCVRDRYTARFKSYDKVERLLIYPKLFALELAAPASKRIVGRQAVDRVILSNFVGFWKYLPGHAVRPRLGQQFAVSIAGNGVDNEAIRSGRRKRRSNINPSSKKRSRESLPAPSQTCTCSCATVSACRRRPSSTNSSTGGSAIKPRNWSGPKRQTMEQPPSE